MNDNGAGGASAHGAGGVGGKLALGNGDGDEMAMASEREDLKSVAQARAAEGQRRKDISKKKYTTRN